MQRTRNKDGTFAQEENSSYIGKKFNKLTVLEIYIDKKSKRKRCKCICDCGNTLDLGFKEFKKRKIMGCGCVNKDITYEELIGRKFGKLLVVEKITYESLTDAKYKCICECGNFVEVSRHNLLHDKNTRSCGCMQRISNINDNISKSNTSGVKGVYFSKMENRWIAKLSVKGKVYKKRFKNFEEAVKYRKFLEEKYHSELKSEYMEFRKMVDEE